MLAHDRVLRDMTPLAAALARHPGAVSFRYGDGPELNARILALIRAAKP